VLGSLLRLATEKMADDDDFSLDMNLDHVWYMLNGVHVPHIVFSCYKVLDMRVGCCRRFCFASMLILLWTVIV